MCFDCELLYAVVWLVCFMGLFVCVRVFFVLNVYVCFVCALVCDLGMVCVCACVAFLCVCVCVCPFGL